MIGADGFIGAILPSHDDAPLKLAAGSAIYLNEKARAEEFLKNAFEVGGAIGLEVSGGKTVADDRAGSIVHCLCSFPLEAVGSESESFGYVGHSRDPCIDTEEVVDVNRFP